MSTPTLTAPDMTVGSLSAGVDALLGIELWRLPGTAEANLIDTLETVCRRLEFAKLLVLADFDSRGIAAEQDALSTAAFLRDRLRISPTDATARVRAARELTATTSSSGEVLSPALPATAAGMATGALSAQHAQVISHAIRRLPTGLDPTVRAGAEKMLARHARELDPAALAIVGRHLHARLDPDGALEDDKPSRRELSFRPDVDGTDQLRGRLDAEAAATVRTAIDALAQPAPAAENGDRDPRSAARRRADALLELCRRYLNAGELPTRGGERPHITITISLHDLQLRLAGHLDTGQPVTAETVRRLACDASIIPMVLGSHGEPLDVGRATRTIPPAIRRAVAARDIGCIHPGCDAPAAWCDVHHVTPWAEDGPHGAAQSCAVVRETSLERSPHRLANRLHPRHSTPHTTSHHRPRPNTQAKYPARITHRARRVITPGHSSGPAVAIMTLSTDLAVCRRRVAPPSS